MHCGKKIAGLILLMPLLALAGCGNRSASTTAVSSRGVQKAVVSVKSQELVHVGGLVFDPLEGQPQVPPGLDLQGYPPGVQGVYLIQFNGYGTQVALWRDTLKSLGAVMGGDYIPDNAALVRMDGSLVERVKKLSFVRIIIPYKPAYKIDRSLKIATGDLRPDVSKLPILVKTWSPDDKAAVIALVNQLGGKVLDGATSKTNRLAATLPDGQLIKLAASPLVIGLSKAVPVGTTDAGGTKARVDYG